MDILEAKKANIVKWNFGFYIVTFLYSILIGVILVPLYLKFIPREIYGYWLATGNVLNLLTLIDPGFSAVIQQKISLYYAKGEICKIGEYSFTGILLGFIFSLLVFIVGFIAYLNFSQIFPDLFLISEFNEVKLSFFLTLIGTILMIIYYIFGAIDYAILSSKGIGLINVFGNFGSMIAIIILLNLGYGIISLGIASLLRGIIFLLLSVLYTYFRFKKEAIFLRWNINIFKDFTSLMGYNFLGKIGLCCTNQIGLYMCTILVGPNITTVLKFTQTVPEFGKLLVTRLTNAAIPVIPNFYYSNQKSDLYTLLSNLFYCSAWLIGLIGIGFYLLNGDFITLWVGRDFYGGNIVNLLVVILLILSVFTEVTSLIAFSLGNIKGNSIMFLIQGIIFVPSLYFATKRYGIEGILMVGIISHLVSTIWYFPFVLVRLLKIGYLNVIPYIKEIFKILSTIFFVLVVFHFLNFDTCNWRIFIYKFIILVACYCIIAIFLSGKIRRLLILKLNSKNNDN